MAYTFRAPVREDAGAITEMIIAANLATVGYADVELNTLLGDWNAANFDLAQDARIALSPDGTVVGYETIYRVRANGRILTDGYVHPDYTGQGIGTELLQWAETRARERLSELSPEMPASLEAGVTNKDVKAQPLFEDSAFSIIRRFWAMEIKLTEPPHTAIWPEGVSVRAFVPGQDDVPVWSAINETFQDHWGSTPVPFEEWQAQRSIDFDPSLWFLAVDGDQIAGVSLCDYHVGNGFVRTLGVRQSWRRKGLGLALLHHCFGEFYRRGTERVSLTVDTESLTGATRLYERAGMEVSEWIDVYGKELRAGVDVVVR